MKKFLLCISVILTQVVHVQALEGDPSWSKTIGTDSIHNLNDVVSTSDGGYIGVGNSMESIDGIQPHKGGEDFTLYKVSSSGNTVWAKNYGGTEFDALRAVAKTTDGNYIAAGYSESPNGNLPGNKGRTDAILLKLDNNGNIMWIKNYGGTGEDFFTSILITADGNLIVAGTTTSLDGDFPATLGESDMFLAKLDASGNKIWAKTYGGSASDSFYQVIQTTDGGFAAAGGSLSNDGHLSQNKGESDALIAKMDALGNLTWIRSYGSGGPDYNMSLAQFPDGSLISAGSAAQLGGDLTSNNGEDDMLLAKFDINGNKKWIKTYGGSEDDMLNSLVITGDSMIIGAGYTSSADKDMPSSVSGMDGVIVKFDENGNKSWVKNYGGEDFGFLNKVKLSTDGNLIAAGTQINFYSFAYQLWILKVEYQPTIQGSPTGNTTITMGLRGSGLQLTSPTGNPTFSGIFLNGTAQTVFAPLAPLSVADYSATFSGYKVTLQASTLLERAPDGVWDTEGVRLSLPAGSLKLKPPTSISVLSGTTNAPTSQISSSTIIDGGASIKLLSANIGQGMGNYQISFNANALELYISPHTKIDLINYPSGDTVYETTLTWSIVSGP